MQLYAGLRRGITYVVCRPGAPWLEPALFAYNFCRMRFFRLHQPSACCPATLHPPGGLPVGVVQGVAVGVEVVVRTPAASRRMLPESRYELIPYSACCSKGCRLGS